MPDMQVMLKAGRYQDTTPEHMDRTLNILQPLDGRNGFVFAVVSVSGKHVEPGELLDLLREHAERLAGSFGRDANPQHRFEQFLRALNEQIAEEVRTGRWDIPIQALNALVGIACEDQMYLSGSGDLTALFLHRKPQNRYQVYNLFRSIQTEQALPTWEKAFAVVLDGDLHPGDAFCVANQDLQRAIQPEELNAIVATLPPPGAMEKIRQYFPHNADLSMVILQAYDEEPPIVSVQPTDVSIQRLEDTRSETTRVLEDQRPRLAPLFALLFKRDGKAAPGAAKLPRKLGMRALSLTRSAGRMAWRVGSWAVLRGKTLVKRDGRKATIAHTRARADQAVLGVLGRFNALPRRSKYLLVAALGVLFLLCASIAVISHSKSRSDDETAYKGLVAQVEDVKGQADGAIIYKDEERARTLYTQALGMVDALPKDSPDHVATAERLRGEILAAFDELRHVVNVLDPPVIADLSAVSPGVSGRALFRVNGDVHVFGSDKEVYRVDPASKTAVRVETTDGEVGVPVEASEENGTVYFLDDRPGVSKFNTADGTLQVTDVAPETDRRWVDLLSYANKLYILQPSGNDTQIVRFVRAGAGFDGGTNWIRAKTTDLSDAVSLAIDATVFVLKQNGQIVRFTSGSEIGWNNEAVDPPVTQATDIWTDADSAFVYVLEPASQRLLVFGKDDGHFVVQYRSDSWSGLTDFLVDEANKTIYLLAGSKVYSIQASHLN